MSLNGLHSRSRHLLMIMRHGHVGEGRDTQLERTEQSTASNDIDPDVWRNMEDALGRPGDRLPASVPTTSI
jgi:hypothetical protein